MKTCDFYKNELSCLNCPYPAKKVPCGWGSRHELNVVVRVPRSLHDKLLFLAQRRPETVTVSSVVRDMAECVVKCWTPELNEEYRAYQAKKKRPAEVATPHGAQKNTSSQEYPKSKDLSTSRSVVRYSQANGRLSIPLHMSKQIGALPGVPMLITYDDGKVIVMPVKDEMESCQF